MVTKLKVYDKKDNVVGEAELNEDGTSKVTIDNLEPNTVYPEGTFRVAHVKNEKVSDYVDVPEFKTKPTTTNKDEAQ